MTQWQVGSGYNYPLWQFQYQQQPQFATGSFTPMFFNFNPQPLAGGNLMPDNLYMMQPTPFWGSSFGKFLANMLGVKFQQPVINTSEVYNNMGLNLTGNQPVSQNDSQPVSGNAVPVQQAAQDAVKIILENFDSSGLPDEVKTYLAKIEFADEPFGAARADIQNGKIIVNTANGSANTTDMVKVLIHESLHCMNKSPFSSVEEEYNCEKQAIQTTAKLIDAGKLEDYKIYNHSMKELGANEKLLDSSLEGWLKSGGYNNRILDSKGNVNIEQYEIHSGDVIRINGKEYGKIGEHFLEGMQSSSICQMFSVSSQNKPNTSGIVVFDNTTHTQQEEQRFLQQKNNPQKIEIVRNGVVICTGTVYNFQG